jgi:hypothetical protein
MTAVPCAVLKPSYITRFVATRTGFVRPGRFPIRLGNLITGLLPSAASRHLS